MEPKTIAVRVQIMTLEGVVLENIQVEEVHDRFKDEEDLATAIADTVYDEYNVVGDEES